MDVVYYPYLAHRNIHSLSLLSGCRCLHCDRATGCKAGNGSRRTCPCTLWGTGTGSRRPRWCTPRRSCRVTDLRHTHWRPVCRSFPRRRVCRYRCSGTQWQSTCRCWHMDLRHRGRLVGTVYLKETRNTVQMSNIGVTSIFPQGQKFLLNFFSVSRTHPQFCFGYRSVSSG